MPSAQELKARIPGWGADLDPKNRPGVPREANQTPYDKNPYGDQPERQVPKVKILRSPEHLQLTPIFGSTCPPKGLSGILRRYAYTLSEGNKAHWAILLVADRIDVAESALSSLLKLKPHNPLREMGLGAELQKGAFRSRFGQNRRDVQRMRSEALVALGIGAFYLTRKIVAGRKAA